jgi:hypothetical protein
MLLGVGIVLVLMVLVVAVFAWCKPKNLVYGERGHRAETKMSFGTEKQELSEAEVSRMQGTVNAENSLPSIGGHQ